MPYKVIWQKPRLHENTTHRKVDWLELFFDLVFMVVISELVHLLSEDPSLEALGNYFFLFIPAWWIWIGATYYNDRFETEGLENRFITFLLMLPVSGLAIFAHHMPDKHSLGYGICYLIGRFVIVLLWLRAAIHEKRFRPVGKVLISGYCFSMLLFLISLWIDPPVRYIFWTFALACDLLTPLFSLKRQAALPSFHLPKLTERLGLFMLIVMGETLVGVIRGVARHHHISYRIISEGIVGVAISFALWWIYFDYIARKSPKSSHRTVFLWSYLHLILVMGIGAIGASLMNILTAKHHIPADHVRLLMTYSLAICLIFIGLIEIVLKPEENESVNLRISIGLKFFAALFVLCLGCFGHLLHSMGLLLLILLALCLPMGYGAYTWFFEKITLEQIGDE